MNDALDRLSVLGQLGQLEGGHVRGQLHRQPGQALAKGGRVLGVSAWMEETL